MVLIVEKIFPGSIVKKEVIECCFWDIRDSVDFLLSIQTPEVKGFLSNVVVTISRPKPGPAMIFSDILGDLPETVVRVSSD